MEVVSNTKEYAHPKLNLISRLSIETFTHVRYYECMTAERVPELPRKEVPQTERTTERISAKQKPPIVRAFNQLGRIAANVLPDRLRFKAQREEGVGGKAAVLAGEVPADPSDELQNGPSNQELLDMAQKLPNPFENAQSAEGLIPPEDIIDVGTGKYLVSRSGDKKRFASTSGMATCVAVGLWDPNTKTTAIAHFSTSDSPESILSILRDMNPGKNDDEIRLAAQSMQVVIRGGWRGMKRSEKLAAELIRTVNSLGMNLSGVELFPKRTSWESKDHFTIDPDTGTVYTQAHAISSAKEAKRQPKQQVNKGNLLVRAAR